jgi:predicted nucleic acid-binding protein
MSNERAVVNASPLIALMGIGQEGLLPELFTEVMVPTAVLREIRAGLDKDPNAARLDSLDWMRPVSVGEIPESILGWTLGRGESEVLTHAAETVGAWAVLDDLAARRCARSIGVRVIGTGRILVLAKRNGLISSVKEQVDRLMQADFRLSDRLIGMLLHEAGEEG